MKKGTDRFEPDSIGGEIEVSFEFSGGWFVRAFPFLVISTVLALALFVRLLSSNYDVDLMVLLKRASI